jgi:hypothetical protein
MNALLGIESYSARCPYVFSTTLPSQALYIRSTLVKQTLAHQV